jgi:predicted AAA+ superfamily ATPase
MGFALEGVAFPHVCCGICLIFRRGVAVNEGASYGIVMATGPVVLSRVIPLVEDLARGSVLLLGPRRTGKSFLIRHQIEADRVYNLLRADTFQALSARPSLVREELQPDDRCIVIDEIQKLPNLMDEVHLMIEERGIHFLLTGSSARKLKRTHTSLMAGRAKTRLLYPFVSHELPHWDLFRALRFGMLPPVVLADDPEEVLSTYVGDYLREEIQAEALTRKIENFSRFLHRAAMSNAELLNFESIASDAQVPARTVREYYAILSDTLLGVMLEPLDTGGRRKCVAHGKFHFFDVGVVHALLGSFDISESHPLLGKALEQLVFQELRAYLGYRKPKLALNFWRTQQGDEVDFVVGGNVAIEVKASTQVSERDFRGLERLAEERTLLRRIVVSRDARPRTVNGIDIMPVKKFFESLWAGQIV